MKLENENEWIVGLHFEIPDALLRTHRLEKTDNVFQLTSDVADELCDAPPEKRGEVIWRRYNGARRGSKEHRMARYLRSLPSKVWATLNCAR